MNRRIPVLALALLTLLPLLSCSSGGGGEERKNLLIVVFDTLRRDAVSCYGSPEAITPNIDRLAREGILIAHAQAQVPVTQPSHSTLFTGFYPGVHGTRHNGMRLSFDQVTLAEMLAEQGYETSAFLGTAVLSSVFQISQGFETYEDNWDREMDGLGYKGIWERRAESVTETFLSWFGGRDRSRPFFAWVHFYDPHFPYIPEDPYTAIAGGDPYAGEVTYTDRQFGRVIDALEKEGILDETVVVFLSDHGEGLGEHGEKEHGLLLYETTLAIPWLIRLPGRTSAEVIASPVETVDLLPTLAGLFPIEPNAAWKGRSLLPLLDGEESVEERIQYSESYYGNIGYSWAPIYSVRLGDWKLVRGTRDELFHLGEDPAESRDRSAGNAEIVERLGGMLDRIRERDVESEEKEILLTAEQRDMLVGLGYVAPTTPSEQTGDLPDPRDRYPAHALILESREHMGLGQNDLAMGNLIEALDIDTENVDAMLRLAQLRHLAGERDMELELFHRILAVDPEHAPSWNNIGNMKEESGDTAGAIVCYGKAIQGDSTLADAYVNRGNSYMNQDALDEAMKDYRQALQLDPGKGTAHLGKAMVYNKQGNMEGVSRELQLALRVQPTLNEASRWLEYLRENSRGGS